MTEIEWLLASSRQTSVSICIYKKLHVEHFTYFFEVEDKNSFDQDNICWINRLFIFSVSKEQITSKLYSKIISLYYTWMPVIDHISVLQYHNTYKKEKGFF